MAPHDRDWMVRAKCRGTDDYAAYDADNRGGGQAEQLERACGGCTVKPECAAYALKHESTIGGMIWAGVPIPESPTTIYYHRALDRLRVIARNAR
ncbi:WhiB family transcriptional regulator [Nocardia pseudobrasiliensis]|nr:WhiB family transcriptional regulator [Nocardia pseudobrasiliensis]